MGTALRIFVCVATVLGSALASSTASQNSLRFLGRRRSFKGTFGITTRQGFDFVS